MIAPVIREYIVAMFSSAYSPENLPQVAKTTWIECHWTSAGVPIYGPDPVRQWGRYCGPCPSCKTPPPATLRLTPTGRTAKHQPPPPGRPEVLLRYIALPPAVRDAAKTHAVGYWVGTCYHCEQTTVVEQVDQPARAAMAS